MSVQALCLLLWIHWSGPRVVLKVGRSEDKVEAKLKLSKIGRRKPLSVNLDAQLALSAFQPRAWPSITLMMMLHRRQNDNDNVS